MDLNKTINTELNKQMNREFMASYAYLAMSAFFEEKSLVGMAGWMKKQSAEEQEHAMKIFDFINQRNGKVELLPLKTPESVWKTPLDVFQKALTHEQHVTKAIHNLRDLTVKEKDHATDVFLHWFITEQVEEEDTASEIVDRLELIGNSKEGLLLLDKELGERK